MANYYKRSTASQTGRTEASVFRNKRDRAINKFKKQIDKGISDDKLWELIKKSA